MGTHHRQLCGFQCAVEGLGTVDDLLHTSLGALGHCSIDPLLAPLAVAPLEFLGNVLQLGVLQTGRDGRKAGGDPLQRDLQAGLQFADDGAHLFGGYWFGGHGLQLLELLGQQWNLCLSVPVLHRLQVIAHAQALLAVKVKIAVQPPVGQGGSIVVAQTHGAATTQRPSHQ